MAECCAAGTRSGKRRKTSHSVKYRRAGLFGMWVVCLCVCVPCRAVPAACVSQRNNNRRYDHSSGYWWLSRVASHRKSLGPRPDLFFFFFSSNSPFPPFFSYIFLLPSIVFAPCSLCGWTACTAHRHTTDVDLDAVRPSQQHMQHKEEPKIGPPMTDDKSRDNGRFWWENPNQNKRRKNKKSTGPGPTWSNPIGTIRKRKKDGRFRNSWWLAPFVFFAVSDLAEKSGVKETCLRARRLFGPS